MKRCRQCKKEFEPTRPLQSVCSPECALLVAMKKTRQEMLRKASAERQDTLKKRKAMRSMSELRQRAQKAFNAYITGAGRGRAMHRLRTIPRRSVARWTLLDDGGASRASL